MTEKDQNFENLVSKINFYQKAISAYIFDTITFSRKIIETENLISPNLVKVYFGAYLRFAVIYGLVKKSELKDIKIEEEWQRHLLYALQSLIFGSILQNIEIYSFLGAESEFADKNTLEYQIQLSLLIGYAQFFIFVIYIYLMFFYY